MSVVNFLASKHSNPRALERFLADTILEGDLKTIPYDNGSEFAGDCARLCYKHRIRRALTNVGTPQQIGSVERSFGILYSTQMARE